MSASVIQPQVQRMIDHPGIYICTSVGAPWHAVIIASMGGKLIMMEMDKELDPTRFNDGLVVKHGPLLPYDSPPGDKQ